MKIFSKLFALTIITALVFTLSACNKNKNNENSKPDDTSKPTVSTPSEDNTTTESKPEENKKEESKPENKPEENKQEESKPENKPVVKPEPVKKSAKELIVGKWTAKGDLAPILADQGIDLEGPLEITLNTEFTTSGTLIERADSAEIYPILVAATKQALLDEIAAQNITQTDFEEQIGMTLDEYVEDAIASLELEYDNLFTFIAEYKFVEDVLLVKSDDTPFVETQYTFINDNTLKIITDSEETIYTRVK
ncbi:MAG: hypothetical protein J6B80_04365 [Clostridia bacterium]|nr:hypothetical protein [Clostridia bacterium]